MDPARFLLDAAGRVRLLGAVVPIDAHAERARLVAEAEAGRDATPRWTYARTDLRPLASELDDLASVLGEGNEDGDDLLALLYAARARELAVEARLASSAGTPGFGDRALRRFQVAPADARRAEKHARAWAALPVHEPEGPMRTTSGPEPESLLSQMRKAIGEARVPFAVEVREDLLALAATGERAVFVAANRTLTDEDVRRTVAHELAAHVLPRVRAAAREPKIFQLGTARGADDQEGYAIVLEERFGLLTARRRRSLGLRHLATSAMGQGSSFVECVRMLQRDHGVAARDAVTLAERAYRGGDGRRAGLGRERVYIASFESVRDHLLDRPEDEELLASGQIALEALPHLRALVEPSAALN